MWRIAEYWKKLLWLTVIIHFEIQKSVRARTTGKFCAIMICCNEEEQLKKPHLNTPAWVIRLLRILLVNYSKNLE